ncbi:MAG: glycosyltransferase family 117 protein [Gammaproteobacteria bacterium]
MPRAVCLEDDGLFIMAAATNGIAHPPGYPLLTLVGYVFSLFPFGTLPWRVHAVSAFFGAAAGGVLWLLLRRLTIGLLPAYTATLGFALSATFWSQAIIAEAYTLNAFFFLTVLLLIVCYLDRPSSRLLKGAAFTYGLGLANHWPLLVLATPALLLPLLPRWREWVPLLPSLLLYLGIGLLPYAWMVMRSWQEPIVSYSGPIESWQELWYVISRQGFAATDHSPSAGWGDKLGYAVFVWREGTHQFGLPGTVLVLWGFVVQWLRWPRLLAAGLTFGWLGGTLVLVLLLGFVDDPFHRSIFRVYPILSYAIAALWLGLGVQEAIGAAVPLHLRSGFFGGLLLLLIVGSTGIQNCVANYRADDRWADHFARTLLTSVPRNAVLLLDSDENVFPIGELHLVEGIRPDVTLYDLNGVIFATEPYGFSASSPAVGVEWVVRHYRGSGRPILLLSNTPVSYAVEEHGLFRQIHPEWPRNRFEVRLSGPQLDYLRQASLSPPPLDIWFRFHQRLLRERYGEVLQLTRESEVSRRLLAECEAVKSCRMSYHRLIGQARGELERPAPDYSLTLTLLDRAAGMTVQALTEEDSDRIWLFRQEALRGLRGSDRYGS